jgi:hypothetical protein
MGNDYLSNREHGYSQHPVYFIWKAMRQRCNNPKAQRYKDYGGRGIKVCSEWNDPINFIEWAFQQGYQPLLKLTLDRIDNDGNYEPSNCRFVPQSINNLNQRSRKDSQHCVYNDKQYAVPALAKMLNIVSSELALHRILRQQCSPICACTRPLQGVGGGRRKRHICQN